VVNVVVLVANNVEGRAGSVKVPDGVVAMVSVDVATDDVAADVVVATLVVIDTDIDGKTASTSESSK
jgi:hypothetical protein